MTVFKVIIPGTASAARMLAVLRAEFTEESHSITVQELEGEFEVLLRKIDAQTKELSNKDEDHAKLIKSIEEAHKQKKELLTETSHLRHKYEKQKTALIAALWQHCAPFHPELAHIPVIPEERVVETIDGVDRYTFKRILGEGQFASVRVCHLADGKSSPSALAIKIINKDRIASFSSMRRVSNEIEALKVLKSKHTLAIHDVIQTPAYLYLVMDRGGLDLFCFFDAFPDGTSEQIGKDISLRILSAVAHCHKHKFCHLDLKPENVLVEFDSDSSKIINLKLCDFGMCSKFEDGIPKYDFCGSPGFFAPEMLIQRKYYGDKADVWSVGCIMLELFLGHQIFSDRWMQSYHHDGLKDSSKFEKAITTAMSQLPYILPLSKEMVQLITIMFQMDPVSRPSVLTLLNHACFDDIYILRNELQSLDLSDDSFKRTSLDSLEKMTTKALVENCQKHMVEEVNTSLTSKQQRFHAMLPPIKGNLTLLLNPARTASAIKILLVDDSLVCLKIFSKFINELGHTVVACINAESALTLIRSGDDHFDCVLMDVNMPNMTAIEAMQFIRKENLDMTVILMSASAEYEDEAISCGANAFILKPFKKIDLEKILNKSLSSPYSKLSPTTPTSSERLRAIIVDDSAVCLKILCKSFTEIGYEVDLFFDGKQAFQHLQRCASPSLEYDLIVTDISMPVLNGLEFISLCRKKLNLRTPIYAVSSHGKNMIQALACGADGFLEKPVSPKIISETFATFHSVSDYSNRISFEIEENVLALRMKVPLLSRDTIRKLSCYSVTGPEDKLIPSASLSLTISEKATDIAPVKPEGRAPSTARSILVSSSSSSV